MARFGKCRGSSLTENAINVPALHEPILHDCDGANSASHVCLSAATRRRSSVLPIAVTRSRVLGRGRWTSPILDHERNKPQAFRSVIRIIATTLPSLNACSFVSLLQVQTKFFLAVKVFSSCTTRNSPSVIWQTMAFIMGGAIVFDPG